MRQFIGIVREFLGLCVNFAWIHSIRPINNSPSGVNQNCTKSFRVTLKKTLVFVITKFFFLISIMQVIFMQKIELGSGLQAVGQIQCV
jgi:hypothetical protein